MRAVLQTGLSTLSSSECLLAFLLSAGFSDQEIAERQGVVESDVGNTVTAVLAKLGLRDRPALETFIANQLRNRGRNAMGTEEPKHLGWIRIVDSNPRFSVRPFGADTLGEEGAGLSSRRLAVVVGQHRS